MKLIYKPETIYFKHPFKIAINSRISTDIVLIEIHHEGLVGYGEASMPPYLGETHASVIRFLSKVEKIISNLAYPFLMDEILEKIDKVEKGNSAAKCSIDIALHDLMGKIEKKPCYKLFNFDRNNTPYTSATIGFDDEEVVKQKITEASDFKILKIKLDGKNDKAIIELVRKNTDKFISVDVNQGWSDKHKALDLVKWMAEKNILFVEQPFEKNNLNDSAWLSERSLLPIIGDESVKRLSDVEKVKNVFHGVNIKLMKSTGMNEARKMILKAKEYKMKTLIGCMSETSCAVMAAAHLSPLTDWADLDGPVLIKNDFFSGYELSEGKILLGDTSGIGVIKN